MGLEMTFYSVTFGKKKMQRREKVFFANKLDKTVEVAYVPPQQTVGMQRQAVGWPYVSQNAAEDL